MSLFHLYCLVVLLPNLKPVLMAATIISSVGLFLSTSYLFIMNDLIENSLKKPLKIIILVCVFFFSICGIMNVATPNVKQLALMYGGVYVTNNEQITSLPPKILTMVNKYLDEAVEKNGR